jgi:hypothetical protein
MFYLMIEENGSFIPVCGRYTVPLKFKTLQEAEDEARKRVDDALPNNVVLVVKRIGHAYLGGDGESYWHDEAKE